MTKEKRELWIGKIVRHKVSKGLALVIESKKDCFGIRWFSAYDPSWISKTSNFWSQQALEQAFEEL